MMMMDNSISAGLASSSILQHTAPVNIPGSPMNSSIAGLFGNGAVAGGGGAGGSVGSNGGGSISTSTTISAPVNIPGSSLSNFSPTNHHLFGGGIGDPFGHHHMSGGGTGSAPKLNASASNHAGAGGPTNNNSSFGAAGDSLFFQSQLISPNIGDIGSSISPQDIRMPADLSAIRDELQNNSSSLFDNGLSSVVAKQQQSAFMSAAHNSGSLTEYGRLKDELANRNAQLLTYEEQLSQTGKAFESWKIELDENKRKVCARCIRWMHIRAACSI